MKELLRLLTNGKGSARLTNLILVCINSKIENEFNENLNNLSDEDIFELVEILRQNGYTDKGIKELF